MFKILHFGVENIFLPAHGASRFFFNRNFHGTRDLGYLFCWFSEIKGALTVPLKNVSFQVIEHIVKCKSEGFQNLLKS